MSQKVKHLFWRAGFGLSPQEWSENKDKPIKTLVDKLFADAETFGAKPAGAANTESTFFRHKKQRRELMEKEGRGMAMENKDQFTELRNDWIERMASPDESALLERVCLFWHGHFACANDQAHLAQLQLNTIRKHALGNFKDLVVAISKDGGMISYLNNDSNKRAHPNENFARELMELFTIGIGNYTEKDIQESARAFTGWNYGNDGTFEFRKGMHDNDTKTFMGKSGNFDGTDIIDIILAKKETATYIASRVYKYFVNDTINQAHVDELAGVFFKSRYDIKRMMRHLFDSEWFYSEKNMGTKIKSPIDLLAGMMRTLDIQFGAPRTLNFLQRLLGQELFLPPSVKGWDGGKMWINNSSMLFRVKLLKYLMNEETLMANVKDQAEKAGFEKDPGRFKRVTVDFSALTDTFVTASEKELTDYILTSPYKFSEVMAKRSAPDPASKVKEMTKKLIGSPEYQLC